jgi:hypothetical protein
MYSQAVWHDIRTRAIATAMAQDGDVIFFKFNV